MRFPDLHNLRWADLLLPVAKQMLVAVACFAVLVPLADWEFEAVRAAPLAALGAFAGGVIFGVMTGVGFVACQRWRHPLATRIACVVRNRKS